MVRNCLIDRRRFFQLGLGATVGLGCSIISKVAYRNYQLQKLNDPFRGFEVTPLEPSLRQRAANKNLIYGTASDYRILSLDPKFATYVMKECEILVPENDLKWRTLRPHPNQFDFTDGDWLLNFTQTHDLLMRGHTLIWHHSLPDWFSEIVTAQNAEQYLVNHVQTVTKRYRGRMHSWDVVNEAIEPYDDRPDGLRRTPWFDYLGIEYIDLAFRVAAEADPNALLIYNDYGLEYDTNEDEARRIAVLNLLEQLKGQGTPIHGLGIQAHLDGHETRFNAEKFRQFLADVASLDLKILVTELDVADNYLPADIAVRDRIVAAAYEDYLNVVLDEPAVIAVLTWGLSDRYTWLSEFEPRTDGLPVRPLPLDENMNRKLAWNAIARAFDQAPARTPQNLYMLH
ncbi:MAG: endo-1,4-beta-xylanase [Oculatellaceae cyanobacterium bins.114]|nr:endo-1,4-beta-xylanase [Oculatellaceae cyanobacterium bins.114]